MCVDPRTLQIFANEALLTRLVWRPTRMGYHKVGWVLMLAQRPEKYSVRLYFLQGPFYGMG
jgi:hypothetical protein